MSLSRHFRRASGRALRIAAASALVLATAACAENGLGPVDDEEQLLFIRSEGAPGLELSEIYRMNADGSGVEDLTNTPASVYRSMSLSPDGGRVVFNSTRGGCNDVWAMNTDGTGVQQLTANGRCHYAPRWSRDGMRIAFTTTREQNWAVYVMNADGGSQHKVSAPVEESKTVGMPVGWTPAGRLVFQYLVDGKAQTYVVNADGTGMTTLLPLGDESPVWSPDGSRVAFLSSRDGTRGVYVMRADGSDVRRVSNLPGEVWFAPSWGITENDHTPWSPDGTRLAFVNFYEQGGLYVANADGSGVLRVTPAGMTGGLKFNGWSRTGRRIAFTHGVDGSSDIYVVNDDGTGLVNLTPGPAEGSDALWVPRR
jgi:Tol biopolymer transport system component